MSSRELKYVFGFFFSNRQGGYFCDSETNFYKIHTFRDTVPVNVIPQSLHIDVLNSIESIRACDCTKATKATDRVKKIKAAFILQESI